MWPELESGRLDFWFYLGVCDARTRLFRWLSSFGLEDGRTGRTGRVEEGRLVGDPALLDELDARFQEWRALGAPRMQQWRVRFACGDTSRAALPFSAEGEREWTHRGIHGSRQWALARGENATDN